MTPQQFVQKWSKIQIKETAASQSHFNEVCALVGHEIPTTADPTGQFFTFEATAAKTTGQQGRADVWYKGKFIWEYKGPHANLDKAWQQLLLYRESLGNPPLLIVSDLYKIIIHTNFQNTVKEVHEISFDRLIKGDGLALLKRVFFDPESFRPLQTQAHVTEATAETFVSVIESLKKHQQVTGQQYTPEQLAHFVIRLLFCLFAEDLGLLPHEVFTQLVKMQNAQASNFAFGLRNLFTAMRDGGVLFFYEIPYFDGGLFDDDFVPELPPDLGQAIRQAVEQDWSAVDPSIFGTLFERVIDEDKRAQLGAHYTSKEDILLIVEPVLMKPLRDEWVQVKKTSKVSKTFEVSVRHFHAQIASTRVLDPACGSGNFLYMALRQLLDLQKEVIVYARQQGVELPLTVSPSQLYGIEINPYAHELAQITVWIGYLQWRYENGFVSLEEPILRPLKNIERKDAILAYDENGRPVEPVWPEAEVIIGNPPFLGSYKVRSELGDKYTETLFVLYKERVPGAADLVCYWFEKAHGQIEQLKAERAGFIATNSIRGGANRSVLSRIKNTGDIFMAWSDNPWILDGAAVRVSIIGFDNGSQKNRYLDGATVHSINPDLTSRVDLTFAKALTENANICYRSDEQGGPFDIDASEAQKMLVAINSSGRSNSDVVRPYFNALDITRRSRNMWIIDFGVDMLEEEAMLYELPYNYAKRIVKPVRDSSRPQKQREMWWIHRRPAPDMRKAVKNLKRFIITPAVAKYRLFVWLDNKVIPSHANYSFAREDHYFFGVLHSHAHEIWALRQGTWLGKGNDPRYTPTTTFETFPFPWPPGREPTETEDDRVFAIAQAARELNSLRESWLNPPGIGVTISEKQVNKRTLTNLYNALTHYRQAVKGKQRNPAQWEKEIDGIITLDQIEELDAIHTQLDQAVLAAYGWPAVLSDEQILERLLALNLERAGGQ